MGIVRLAQGLKKINSINIYTSRSKDIANKIKGNRVYLDFISIVYKIQENVASELNYLLYSFLLIIDGSIAISELKNKFCKMVKKYLQDNENILSIAKSKDEKKIAMLQQLITPAYVKEFKQRFKQDDIFNEYVYHDIVKFVVDMLTNKISNVLYVLISFDGIPSLAKIQEQRHRRYMRVCLLEFQKQLQTESTHLLRREYDKEHFIPNIKTSLEYVVATHTNGRLKKDLLAKLNKDESYVDVVVLNEKYGEGEKILMDRLIDDTKLYPNQDYVFYSPDGDSVILCLYIYIKTKVNINVIKMYFLNPSIEHNNQCQYIDIAHLYTNVVNMVQTYSKMDLNAKQKDNCCCDFILLLNMFGNDFLHCIPTLDISTTLVDIIYIYSLFLKEQTFVTYWDENNDLKMDSEMLRQWIYFCAKYEEWIMLDTYLANVDDKKRISQEFGDIFTVRYMLDYKENTDIVKQKLRNVIRKGNRKYTQHVLSVELEKLNKLETITGRKYGELMYRLEINRNVNKYVDKIMTGNFPSLRLTLRHKDTNINLHHIIEELEAPFISTNSPIHTDDLEMDKNKDTFLFIYKNLRKQYVPHHQMPTAYHDIEFYMLEWRMGKWKNILNGRPYDFGYKHAAIPIKKEAKRYQTDFLKMSDNEIHEMCLSYLQGLSWITDYYVNKHPTDYISSWSYNYERSPFFTHIAAALDKLNAQQLKQLIENTFVNSLVPVSEYIDETKHKLYIYPITDEKVRKNIHPSLLAAFPNIISFVKNTLKYNNGKKYFDCRLCPFFSKCIFKNKMLTMGEIKRLNS